MRRRRSEKVLAPLRVLMTLDAVSDVWRFGMNLAGALKSRNVSFVFVTLGPAPTGPQQREAEALGEFVHIPLSPDSLAEKESDLAEVPGRIAELAERFEVDLIHLNQAAQAAGLETDKPVVLMSHGCMPTWFRAIGKISPPGQLEWQTRLNRQGLSRADAVLAPSRSHSELMMATYGQIRNLRIVHNVTSPAPHSIDRTEREGIVAVGRWWDEGANGAVLGQVATRIARPLTMIDSDTGSVGQNLQIRNAVHADPVSHSDILQRVGTAEVFVSPSLYEPFGLGPLYAAVSRTPLVLADIPTYRELWDGAALFVSPHDPAAYVEAINRLLNERHLREILAQLASNRATRFTSVRQAAAMRTVYDTLALPVMSMNAV